MAKGKTQDELELSGLVAMVDPPRQGVASAVRVLKNSGVQVRV